MKQAGEGKTGKIQKTKTSNDGVFLANLYVYMVWAESNYSFGEAGTKKFLCFSFSLASTICLTQLPRRASFAASGHITLKSFGHVLKKYCHAYRCKWDGRLGTACNVFELVVYVSVLNAQRIFTNKRKGCWFKTQKVWGKFQRKVVAELELLLRKTKYI